jgi:hypothetical protein
MTADELDAFLADIRARADAALARLDTVDPDALAPDLRAEYDTVRDGWQALRALTRAELGALHLAACKVAARELTPDELRGLLVPQ